VRACVQQETHAGNRIGRQAENSEPSAVAVIAQTKGKKPECIGFVVPGPEKEEESEEPGRGGERGGSLLSHWAQALVGQDDGLHNGRLLDV